ncbi:type II toxin-antitoxin system RelE/ParE family toxin [Limnothrix sp. FACHB-1083]|uniref:type II toxin-antitoxin system RelE family toxin n=1 Tax=unclassified Limnothrix TaxID=2632864 RepID=UPI0016802589|nr:MULTISPECIES: type II toxin-antitoxin system RelE/ParE family toxin [unclassified Limnothrix]MBD2162287.1 type II toxin-antitoxin system RelE/ParE family toxin [Limnothrix sp. FACHB-1083]MBD2193298.1 type II toxin-antitoxin system RelE/ParE family toxin [Limnothrix sp. FACHB-1088]
MYTIEISRSALDDLRVFKKHEQKEVLDEIFQQLTYEPTVETRNRKPLRTNDLSDWELRIGNFRVFYSVEEIVRVVAIEAVGRKFNNQLFIRNQPYDL